MDQSEQLPYGEGSAGKDKDPDGYFWFETNFDEGKGPDPVPKKRKLIEAFYEGYIHAYNEVPGHTHYDITDFIWSQNQSSHHVKVYTRPAPTTRPGAGTVTDPPTPTKPPPSMT